MIINNNISALNTYRQMGINNSANAKSMEKLSSGLRINKAGDDAAGLAISEKMRAQVRGLDQAQRNSQDGISMIQTAEGALQETHNILQRMRELATQAANDTNVDVDRNEIQKEMNQLTSEINRIGNTTEFNTQNILDGGSKASGVSLSSLEAEGVAATGAKISGLQAVDFTNIPTSATGTDDLTITLADFGGNDIAFAIDGEEFTTLWNASAGGATNATEADKRQALKDILSNNLSATWEDAAGASVTAKLGDVANISISDSGVLSIEAKAAGNNLNSGAADLQVTADGAFAALVGLTDGTDYIANGTDQKEATLVGSQSIKAGDTLKASDWAGKSFTVEFNGRTANITLPNELTNHDFTDDEITAADLVADFNTALDGVFGDGAVVASIGVDPNDNTGSTKTFFQFTTDSSVPTNTDEGDIALGTKPSFSIKGDNLDQILGDFVPGSKGSGGTFSATFQIGANQGQAMTIEINDMRSLALGVSGSNADAAADVDGAKFTSTANVTDGTNSNNTEYALDISTHESATAAIKVINNAIETVSAQRSNLGAFQNRLEHTISNLGNASENLTAAESRIRDVDMAKEVMEMTRANILSQASQSMLAQANQKPQSVLQLLG